MNDEKKFNKLNKEDKEMFNDLADKINKDEKKCSFMNLFLGLAKTKKCPFCKRKYPDGLLRTGATYKKGTFKTLPDCIWMIKPDILAHFQETHGISPEVLEMIIRP